MLEPGIAEASAGFLTIAPNGRAALSIRETNEHDVVLLEIAQDGDPRAIRVFVHRAQMIQVARVFGYWRTAYGTGPREEPSGGGKRPADV